MSDFPFDEIVDATFKLIRAGDTIYQKFTCAKCGLRQAVDEPNRLYYYGKCEECGHITDIKKQGCNYILVRDLRK